MPDILDHLAALADPTRCRMLLLLERHELTVSELCAVLQLPQSTVSRHLKTLADERWVSSRRDGTSRFYSFVPQTLDGELRRLWEVVREGTAGTAGAIQDGRRLQAVFARRKSRSQAFFASAAAEWNRLRSELFGRTFSFEALLGLLDGRWTVGDLGCGTGEVAALLSPVVGRVVAVDASPDMLVAAERRLRGHENVTLRQGELEALPLGPGTLDAAVLMLVLHHVPDPAAVMAESARVLKPGGRLLVTDMFPHEREEYKQQMGHVWLGFPEEQMERYFEDAGFEAVRLRPLMPDPDTRGPALFAAAGRRRAPGNREPGAGNRQA